MERNKACEQLQTEQTKSERYLADSDWEQRTPAPYTTMQIDTSYLKKNPTALKKLNKIVGTTIMVLAVAVVWILMSLPSLCHFQVICSNTPSQQVSKLMRHDICI